MKPRETTLPTNFPPDEEDPRNFTLAPPTRLSGTRLES